MHTRRKLLNLILYYHMNSIIQKKPILDYVCLQFIYFHHLNELLAFLQKVNHIMKWEFQEVR